VVTSIVFSLADIVEDEFYERSEFEESFLRDEDDCAEELF